MPTVLNRTRARRSTRGPTANPGLRVSPTVAPLSRAEWSASGLCQARSKMVSFEMISTPERPRISSRRSITCPATSRRVEAPHVLVEIVDHLHALLDQLHPAPLL